MEDDEFVGFMMMVMISYVLCCVALLGVLLAKANTPFVYHNLNKNAAHHLELAMIHAWVEAFGSISRSDSRVLCEC